MAPGREQKRLDELGSYLRHRAPRNFQETGDMAPSGAAHQNGWWDRSQLALSLMSLLLELTLWPLASPLCSAEKMWQLG